MKYSNRHYSRSRVGFTLLVAILVSSVVLAVGISILNISLREYTLSGTGRESEFAFYAADAGLECLFFHDRQSSSEFDGRAPSNASLTCMNQSKSAPVQSASGVHTWTTQFQWVTDTDTSVCAKVTMRKYYSASANVDMGGGLTCPQNVVCTKAESRGYNDICDSFTDRTVERALRAVY